MIGLDPGVRETLGRTMTPGLSSGEAPKSDGTADDEMVRVVDDPDIELVSPSWFLNWSECEDECEPE